MYNDQQQQQHQSHHRGDNGRLPMAEIGAVNKRAQIQGTLTGIAGGLICALVSRRIAPQSPNIVVMTGLISGTGIGYFATRANLHNGMLHLQQHKRIVNGAGSGGIDEMNRLDLQASNRQEYEGGVAGMSEFHDPAHTTRGDH